MADHPRGVTAGQQILHYRLIEKLGEGGMGVVWKAVDTTLDRHVAIKVLPLAFASDPERMARFEREARLLASLNHPNIATIHSVHTVGSERYLTMELVPGDDLARRIAAGPTPVPEAIEIARQIALALEAAHASGVIHRDLKPANVHLTPEGRVKVLDFGLAKAFEGGGSSAVLSQSPTFTGTAMGSGMIIGTAAYMSPEQARGKAVDRRADIWAFGVVLYELLTGRRAFEGETVSDTLAAVLRAEPDRSLLPADLPRAVRALLDRCLEKDPHRRLRDIGEALLVLEDVQAGRVTDEPPSAPTAPLPSATRERLLWGAGLVTVAVLVALVGAGLRPKPAAAPARKLTLMLEQQGTIVSAMLSPDGRKIAYVVGRKLWVRDLGQITSHLLADGLDEDLRPFWSPDGESIGFGIATGLVRVAVASGAITPICPIGDFSGGSGGTWLPDGRIVFAKGLDHLYSVPSGGGTPSVFLDKDTLDADLHQPYVLPGGRAVLHVRHLLTGGAVTLAVSEGNRRRDLLRLASGNVWEPVYDPRGFILFSRLGEGAGVWALPFSLQRLQVTGEPFLLAPEASSVSADGNGDLVYRLGTRSLESRAVLVDAAGAIVDTLTSPQAGCWSMALSPDDRMLVIETRESGEGDLWLHDLERDARTRFAFGPGRQMEPAWSPDGREVVYRDMTQYAILVKPADGTRAPRRVGMGFGPRYTPDGHHLLFVRPSAGGSDIWWMTSDGPGDSAAVVATAASEDFPAPAPQGGFLAYQSDESGKAEIYLRQLPTGPGRWQVSTNGGVRPQWSRNGDRIYYFEDDRIMEVMVTLQPSVRLGTPVMRFRLGDLHMQSFGRYPFLPTSRPDRFVMLKPTEQVAAPTADLVLVQNWWSEFAKK